MTVSFRVAPLRITWHHLAGTGQALRSIYVTEGLGALWKGVGATVMGVMPARAIYFSTYTRGKHVYLELNGGKETPLVHLASAATASIATSTVTNPIWLVKTKMQLQQNLPSTQLVNPNQVAYKNSLDCAIQIFKRDGIRGLYKGLTASYIGIAESTMQWVLYEKMKKDLAMYRAHCLKARDPTFDLPRTSDERAKLLSWFDVFGVAAASKLIAAALSYPHEVLRTRLREDSTKYKGLLQSTRKIWAEEGAAAFYGGMTAHLLKVVPNSAIMFFCYELLLSTYSKLYME